MQPVQVIAGGHSYTFYRGPGHTPLDVAEFGRRKAWPDRDPQAPLEVRCEAGHLLNGAAAADPVSLAGRDLLYVTLPVGVGG